MPGNLTHGRSIGMKAAGFLMLAVFCAPVFSGAQDYETRAEVDARLCVEQAARAQLQVKDVKYDPRMAKDEKQKQTERMKEK